MPLPPDIAQTLFAGGVAMVIRYVAPDACSVLKVEVPSASNGRDSPVTSFFNTIGKRSAPVPNPETDAPIV